MAEQPWELSCPQCGSKNIKHEFAVYEDEGETWVSDDLENCTCLDCGWNFIAVWCD